VVFLFSSAVALGFVHGLGADHLMAIAALSVDRRGRPAGGPAARRRALGVAVRFACGHALLLGLGAAAALLLGCSVPAVVERGGEILGGLLLVGLGAAGLWATLSGRVYGHAHPVSGREPAWHLHLGRPERHPAPADHDSRLPLVVGAVFAVSSLRTLVLLEPFDGVAPGARLPVLVLLVLFFAAGVLLSMSLFGVALARAMSTRTAERLGRAAGVATAAASLALGLYWIAAAHG
jgi:hypothetical protein